MELLLPKCIQVLVLKCSDWSSLGLTGLIPAEITSLKELSSMYSFFIYYRNFGNNSITGLPSGFAEMKNLTNL